MKSSLFITIILGALIGAGITFAVIQLKTATTETTNTASTDSHGTMNHSRADMSMSAMNTELKGKSGDDFDKAFIEMMIEHHQGAIDMANAAKANAKHSEIKAMAADIISAQNREIEQMKDWQKQWGY